MFSGQSILGLSAAGVYLVVMAACLAAALSGASRRQPHGHVRQWFLILGLFAVLLALRAFGLEDGLRRTVRGALWAGDAYASRRDIQRPVAAFVTIVFSAVAFAMTYRFAKGGLGKRNVALGLAGMASLVMVAVVTLRIVSLHQIDELLYGRLKINWIMDLGMSLVVLGSALFYVRLMQSRK